MTPEQKAKELVFKYKCRFTSFGISENIALIEAKQCALICVDEIYKIVTPSKNIDYTDVPYAKYWQEVKQHIDKL